MLTLVPPKPDVHPADIKEGYWFSLAPSFPATTLLRDYPFGVEPTKNPTFHALTFVDLVGKDAGLLVLHPATQFFRRDEGGGISNLVMREWESFFTRDIGWPIYAEYRHALLPHIPAEGKPEFRNADALRAAAALAQPLLCHVAAPQQGELPTSKSFLVPAPATSWCRPSVASRRGRWSCGQWRSMGGPATPKSSSASPTRRPWKPTSAASSRRTWT